MKKRAGFTLIELLIVVAIIAILAVIAVPNFLEAQTRAKVARCLEDMRTLATALESYLVDNNKYPPDTRDIGPDDGSPDFTFWIRPELSITTPIAYISSVFPDPFNITEDVDNAVLAYWGPDYLKLSMASKAHILSEILPSISDGTTLSNPNIWILFSYSPDQDFDCLDDPVGAVRNTGMGWPQVVQEYDATNGSISDGDIFRSTIRAD